MALVRDAEPAAGSSRWLPTHVQVTVLRASGLRGKSSGAGSTSDAYTVIQVGREKYSTSVVEKTQGCPEWCEECSFELPPGALDGLLRAQEADGSPAPWASGPNAACELVLTTMHRSLIGVDKFLGRATVALDEVFRAGRAQHTQWYKLYSKPGKKEKERGEIQVTIQFTRNNLSASMFDLSMKDKPRSPFSKLKDKVKGKKKYELESASAILPSSALEDPDLGSLGKMGKAKGFFLRNKLRKSSLTQSNTSLGSDSTLSSTSGSLAYQGPGAELLTRSPSHSSWLSTEGGRDSTQSPKLLTHKRTYSDEASQLRAAPPRALLELQGHLDGASRSSLCVNGSHVYNEEPQPPLRHRSSISGPFPTSTSLHSAPPRPSEEGPRASDDSWGRGSRGTSSSEAVPGQEALGTQAKVLALGAGCSGEEEGARPSEGKPVQVATPMVASSEAVAEKERKPRMGLFHHHHHHQGLSRSELGRRGSVGEKGSPSLGASPHHSSTGEEKAKSSWFGLRESKESTQKPSASRASLAPLASPGKTLPEWDDTFNIFAAGRLQPEARSEILVPAEMGLEEDGLQDPGPGTMALKATEPQRDPGGERDGSRIWLEPRVPVDSGLDQPSTSVSDPGPFGSSGTHPSSRAAQLHLKASASTPDRELPASEVGAGQSPADSGASLFSSPEVLSVWERLPGSDDIPGGQDEEAPQDEGQLFQELNTVEDSWPWDVITISPTAEIASSIIQGESDEAPPLQVQPESPAAVHPMESEGHPALQLEPEPEPEQGLDEGPWPGPPPPKPPRLFTPTNSQVEEEEEEEDQEEEENATGGLDSGGPGIEEEITPSALVVGPQESREEGANPELEGLHSLPSGTLMGEPELEELVGDTGAPESGASPTRLTSCLEGPIFRSHSSTGSTLLSQKVWGTSDTGENLKTQSQELAKEGFGPLSVTPQQADLWASEEEEEDALNPFLCQESQDPPSLPSISPPGSRESSIRSGPEELPTPPEPAFPPPPLPPWASHRHGVPGPPCPPLPVAWPLTSSSSPPEESASPLGPLELSPTGGSPTPYGEDHAAATPASPLALLPLETRPAEELQPSGSPHPVKPLSAAPVEASPDRKQTRTSLSTALSSGLEKLKTVTSGSIQSVVPASQLGPAVDTKKLKDSAVPDQSAKYYHLTHDELIGLLLQRERELSQRDEHVQELESYIDRLLVRIMETSPTLLQISPAPPK
ncbi:rab11 family-interacting protein 5 isoform X2 [Microtus ochrogaster]|uniref:Rab11 family-interacting protein 5 isoform X2 n=1 Tax=Microtus ochrogaster TaxID=79684 RepID=A0ABM0LNV5_MICOH|nr:rab11 family-interacting protein 5 isoform X2 [Microtus ochrogaster]